MTATFSAGLAGPLGPPAAAKAASGRGSKMTASKPSTTKLHRRQDHEAPDGKANCERCRFSWECDRLALITLVASFATGPIPSGAASPHHPAAKGIGSEN